MIYLVLLLVLFSGCANKTEPIITNTYLVDYSEYTAEELTEIRVRTFKFHEWLRWCEDPQIKCVHEVGNEKKNNNSKL